MCYREGGTLQTNTICVCGECLQYLGHTVFAPTHSVCAFPVYTAQAPGYSAGELSGVGPGLHALPRSTQLRLRFSGTPQRHRQLCLRFVPFPGPSSSGDQVFGEHTLPWYHASYHLPGPSRLVFCVCSCISGVPCVSSGKLISDCDPPDVCQLSRIPGRLGQRLRTCSQFGRGCPFLFFQLWLAPTCLCASSGGWAGPQLASSPLVFAQSFVLCAARQCLRLELFVGKCSLSLFPIFFFSLCLSQFGLLSQVSSIRLPSGHSGPILTLSSAARTSLFSPHLLVADKSVWATSPLGVVVRPVICGVYLFFPPGYVAL